MNHRGDQEAIGTPGGVIRSAARNRPRTEPCDPTSPRYTPRWTVRSSRVNSRRSTILQAIPWWPISSRGRRFKSCPRYNVEPHQRPFSERIGRRPLMRFGAAG